MARINFENSVYSDERFIDLCKITHSTFEAIGMLMSAWKLAQDYFLNEETHRIIPVEAWQRQKLGNKLIEVGFAEQQEHGIYVKGSKDQFAWLLKCQESGKRGGDAKANKTRNESRVPLANPRVIYPPTLPLSQKKEEREGVQRSPIASAPKPHKIFEIWNTHRGKLPEARALSNARRKHAEMRWRENPDAQYWIDIVVRASISEFCNGKNERGWVGDFDWILQPNTHLKILEGKYDNRKSVHQTKLAVFGLAHE